MATTGKIASEESPGARRLLRAGDRAPPFEGLPSDRVTREGRDEGEIPTVVALFADEESAFASDREQEASRGALRALGAVLVAMSPRWVWVFRPDEELQVLDRVPRSAEGEPPALFDAFGVEPDGGSRPGLRGLFVIDGKGTVRFAHRPGRGEQITLGTAVQAASRAMLTPASFGPRSGSSRREFLLASLVAGFAMAVAEGCIPATPARDAGSIPREEVDLTLEINGQRHPLRVEPRVSLLDALRENLGLTGTKKGCDHGQCGACTVLVDGRRINACLTLAVMAEGAKITTIEGLGTPEALHPMQAAFVAEDALQCGYCTPGQIMSAVGLVSEGHAADDDDIRESMSGNLCRCGAYPNIVTAIRRGRGAMTSEAPGGSAPKGAS